MARSRDVMGGGFSAGQAQALGGQTNSSVAAAGTNQGTATALTASNNFVSSGTGGVIVPNDPVGDSINIFNNSGTGITVYPPTGCKINQLSTNTGFVLGNNTLCTVYRWSSTQLVAEVSA